MLCSFPAWLLTRSEVLFTLPGLSQEVPNWLPCFCKCPLATWFLHRRQSDCLKSIISIKYKHRHFFLWLKSLNSFPLWQIWMTHKAQGDFPCPVQAPGLAMLIFLEFSIKLLFCPKAFALAMLFIWNPSSACSPHSASQFWLPLLVFRLQLYPVSFPNIIVYFLQNTNQGSHLDQLFPCLLTAPTPLFLMHNHLVENKHFKSLIHWCTTSAWCIQWLYAVGTKYRYIRWMNDWWRERVNESQ